MYAHAHQLLLCKSNGHLGVWRRKHGVFGLRALLIPLRRNLSRYRYSDVGRGTRRRNCVARLHVEWQMCRLARCGNAGGSRSALYREMPSEAIISGGDVARVKCLFLMRTAAEHATAVVEAQ